jgi:hypothetical protein
MFWHSNILFGQDTIIHQQNLDSSAKITVKKDTSYLFLQFNTNRPIPKRAAMYSALLPGLGQVYNKRYWKIPIVYIGVGVSAYYFTTTYKDYQTYRKAFIERTDNNPKTIDNLLQYDDAALRSLERSNRQLLDRIVVYSAVYYGLNIVDAMVDAHLKNFDVSKSISMKIGPKLNNNTIGIGMCLAF